MARVSDMRRILTEPPRTMAMPDLATVLRSFYLDGGDSLVQSVNRHYKEKLTYAVNVAWATPEEVQQAVSGALIPVGNLSPYLGVTARHDVRMLTDDQFLKLPILYIRGEAYTVREMILCLANVRGGAHYSAGRDPRVRTLGEQAAWLEINGYSLDHWPLPQVGWIVLHGLQPLLAHFDREFGQPEQLSGVPAPGEVWYRPLVDHRDPPHGKEPQPSEGPPDPLHE